MNGIGQLCDLYREYGYFKELAQHDELSDTIIRLLRNQRVVWHEEDNKIVGCVESWRLDFEQWGRKVCHERINIREEDIVNGPVCYLANVIILPGYRTPGVVRILRDLFFHQNRDAEFFVGLALRKKTQPIKVFRASQLSQARFNGIAEAIYNG